MPLATTAAPAKKRMLPEGERVDVAALILPPPSPVLAAPVLLTAEGSPQASVLHACELAPLQLAPPFAGTGLVQVRT